MSYGQWTMLANFQLVDFNAAALEATLPYSADLMKLYGQASTLRYWTTRHGWIFPQERFTTYGPEDERWCRFFGVGHEGTVKVEYSCEAVVDDIRVEPPMQDLVLASLSFQPIGPVTIAETELPAKPKPKRKGRT